LLDQSTGNFELPALPAVNNTLLARTFRTFQNDRLSATAIESVKALTTAEEKQYPFVKSVLFCYSPICSPNQMDKFPVPRTTISGCRTANTSYRQFLIGQWAEAEPEANLGP